MLYQRFLALLLVAAFASPAAFAGYAQLKPPVGWSKSVTPVPGQAGNFNFGAAANGSTFKGTTVHTNASLTVAGQLITVPVALRTAANAGTFAAGFSFGNPYLFAGLAVGSLAYQWFVDQGFSVRDGQWVRSDPSVCTSSPCYGWAVLSGRPDLVGSTKADAAQRYCTSTGSGTAVYSSNMSGYLGPGWSCGPYNTRESGLLRIDVSPSDPVFSPVGRPAFEEAMSPVPLPALSPQYFPFPLPVTRPWFNPDPAYDPNGAPSDRPLWVPTGDPVKNPNPNPGVDPDTWTQPGVRVTPSPTESDPWRVDVVPEPKTKPNATPNDAPSSSPNDVPEFETCGLPGKPKCAIDETGTPAYDPETMRLDRPALDADAKANRDQISGTADKGMFEQFRSLFSLPPLRACEPLVYPDFMGQSLGSADICPGAEWLRGLMEFIWAGAGFAFCFSCVKEVI